jgi:hypothetical protein
MSLDRLAELAIREEAAVASRRWDALHAIQAEQRDLLDSLPEPLPGEARTQLELALSRSRATQRSLFAMLAETQGIIERLRAGRRTVGAYGLRRLSDLETRA